MKLTHIQGKLLARLARHGSAIERDVASRPLAQKLEAQGLVERMIATAFVAGGYSRPVRMLKATASGSALGREIDCECAQCAQERLKPCLK